MDYFKWAWGKREMYTTPDQDGRERIMIKEEIKPPRDWTYDPYKSKHYANSCICLPGKVYNLKKERQIRPSLLLSSKQEKG